MHCYSLPAGRRLSVAVDPLRMRDSSANVFNLSQKPRSRLPDDFEASTVEKFRHSRYASTVR